MIMTNKFIIIFFLALILGFLLFAQVLYTRNTRRFKKLTLQKPYKYPPISSVGVSYTCNNLTDYDRVFIIYKKGKKKDILCYYDFNFFYLYINDTLLNNTNILHYEWVFKMKKNSSFCYNLCLIQHRKVFGTKILFEFTADYYPNATQGFTSIEDFHYVWYKNRISIEARMQEHLLMVCYLIENNAFNDINIRTSISNDGKISFNNIQTGVLRYTFIWDD